MFSQVTEFVAVEHEVSAGNFESVDLFRHRGWGESVVYETGVGFPHVELVAVVGDHNVGFVKQLP